MTKILIVTAKGGDYELSMKVAQKVKECAYEVEFITPQKAKEMQLEPADEIVPVKAIIPQIMQFYPLSAVEPNRRTRRLKKRK